MYFWLYLDFSDFLRWSDDPTYSLWLCLYAQVPVRLPSPENCTHFHCLFFHPCCKHEIFDNSYRNWRELPQHLHKFFTRSLTSVEYNSDSWVTASFNLSIFPVAEENLCCQRPALPWSHPTLDAGAGTCSPFFQCILPAPGSQLHWDFLIQRPCLCFCV